eukprot:PRCOL_00005057-RA
MGASLSSAATAAAPADVVQRHVNDNAVAVFSKTYCSYCRRVKTLLGELGVRPAVLELDTIPDGRAVQGALSERSGMRTVPQVFIAGKLIGGADECDAAHRRGELQSLLAEAIGRARM